MAGAQLELLEAEKELTRRSDELAQRRRELPWGRIDKEYRFDTDDRTQHEVELIGGAIFHIREGKVGLVEYSMRRSTTWYARSADGRCARYRAP